MHQQIATLLTSSYAFSWDPDFKIAAAHVISPPLRNKEHQTALRRALAGGHLHLVATDHCGWNSTQKAVGRHDFRCRCLQYNYYILSLFFHFIGFHLSSFDFI